MIREWKWNEHHTGSDGVTLCTDRVNFWSVNWAFPYGDASREYSLDEFRSSGSPHGAPATVWKELHEEISKLEV